MYIYTYNFYLVCLPDCTSWRKLLMGLSVLNWTQRKPTGKPLTQNERPWGLLYQCLGPTTCSHNGAGISLVPSGSPAS